MKLLEHADRLEKDGVQKYTRRYYKLTQQLRREFAYGTGQKVARSMAKAFKMAWLRPAAPQEGGTRTVAFEIQRVPPVFINNFVVYYQALTAMIRLSPAKEKEKYRRMGLEFANPALCCFIVARYEARRLLRKCQGWPKR